nr:NEL-type E3 ubiquitin ligase domain-containing protein [Pseudomonas sp. Marseille-Q3773]
MSRETVVPQTHTSPRDKIARATDDFIAARLPAWLTRASPAQINRLRDGFMAHQASQEKARQVTRQLQPVVQFAQLHFQQLVRDLPTLTPLSELQWLEIRRRFSVPPGIALPEDELVPVRESATLRLMQNFTEDASFYVGTGLVEKGDEVPLDMDLATLVSECRRLDVGARYQHLLNRVFTPANCALLAEDKRAGLRLAAEVAALRGDITAHQQLALVQVGNHEASVAGQGVYAFPGLASMLGCQLSDVLLVQLRNGEGADLGVVLYLPSEPARPLRHFASTQAMNDAMAAALQDAAYRDYFSQLVALDERPSFITQLRKRLSDPQPDLTLEGHSPTADVFASLVERQVQRVKDDARLLLVPTAQVDQQASDRRREGWRALGLGLVNLAGLFIPVVGIMLLGQLVVQTLAEVYEGAADWFHGHQHEALEHMLGVAETLAVAAAVSGGAAIVARGFASSDYVAGLEPVAIGRRDYRLWANDLSVYRGDAEEASVGQRGLLEARGQYWLRIGGHDYEVHRPVPEGAWRLRHPERADGYGPRLEYNGELGWRLHDQRPLESEDADDLLASLWRGRRTLDAGSSQQVLSAALVDLDELRGLCVESRTLPPNLRETLEQFDAQARIEAFFRQAGQGMLPADDPEILTWCRVQLPDVVDQGLLRQQVVDQAHSLRRRLMAYLTRVVPGNDPLLALVARDFPGLAPRYAQTLVQAASTIERRVSLIEGKLAQRLALKAASLLRLARLCRARAGLMLPDACSDEAAELIMSLLPRLALWPSSLSLELWSERQGGRRLAALGRQGNNTAPMHIFAAHDGRFSVRDAQGRIQPLAIDEPAGLLETVLAVLTPEQRRQMGLSGSAATQRLRAKLVEVLPTSRAETERLLGWPAVEAWFNPGRRMPDGRVGYPLSGSGVRHRSPESILRDRLRNLYPGLDAQALEEHMARLLADSRSPFEALMELEDDYAQLDVHLNRWISAELAPTRRAVRERFAAHLRRAWRLQAEPIGTTGEQRLVLVDLAVTTLPELPGHLAFSHITSLVISDSLVTAIHPQFLSCFTALRELNLSNNRLLRIPSGIAYLVHLRRLRLAHNAIRLDLAALDAINGLPQLRYLDLSYNPLGAYSMRYNQLTHLVELNLRHCQLGEWPPGIELCGLLERADLRDNRLATVPDAILQMPHAFRRAFLVERTPLGMLQLHRLFALAAIQEPLPLPEPPRLLDPLQTRQVWLAAVAPEAAAERLTLWDAMAAMPGNQGFIRLLGRLQDTADFNLSRAVLTRSVWDLCQAIQADPELRQRLFALADMPLGCSNSVAERFSELQLQAAIRRAEGNTLEDRGEQLLVLGRGLFYLDRLEMFTRADLLRRTEAGESVEALTLRLLYRVRLRQRLGLPYQPQGMNHTATADVTDAEVEQALREVRAALNPDSLAQSLSQRLFWQRYMEQRHPAAFAALAQVNGERRALLTGQRAQLDAQEFAQRLARLEADEATDRQALILHLSRQLLIGRERGQA